MSTWANLTKGGIQGEESPWNCIVTIEPGNKTQKLNLDTLWTIHRLVFLT